MGQERISIDCHNIKAKVITLANQKKVNYHKEPIRTQGKKLANRLERGKTWVNESRLVLGFILIDEKMIRVFWTNTERGKAKTNQSCISNET